MNSIYIALNLFKRMFTDYKSWISNLLLPTLIVAAIVAFTGKSSADPVMVGYVNLDKGDLGNRVIEQLSQKPDYRFVLSNEQEMKKQIISGKLPVGIVIPENFTDHLEAGQPVQIQDYFLNQTETSITLEYSVNQSIGQMDRTVQLVKQQFMNPKDAASKLQQVLDQQAKQQVKTTITQTGKPVNDHLYLVIGFILFFVMGLIMSSLGLVLEDRNQKTMARISAAPVRSFEIALGNFLGSFGLGLLQILIILLITKYVIGFDYGVDFIPLLLVFVFFVLATVGIGSAVAGFIKNNSNMSAINSLIITPTCMIGGTWWPIAIMPGYMQKLANFVPQKWAIDAIQKMSTGQNLLHVSINLGILMLFAIIFLGFGAVVLKPNEESVTN